MSTLSPHDMDESASAVDDDYLFMRRRRHEEGGISGLNLTAMMDVMTILLVYLIKVYASSPENITLNDDLRPPASTAPDAVVPAIKVLVSQSAIVVDEKVVLRLEKGAVVVEGDATAGKYQPLARALEKRVSEVREVAARTGGKEFDGILMVVADEDAPYGLIADVLIQAGKAQFTSYRLTVKHK